MHLICAVCKNTLAWLYWVFLSLPDRCVCGGVYAPSYCGGVSHRSRHRVLCTNLSDLSDMACVLDVCWGCASPSSALSTAVSVTDMYLCTPTGMVCWRVLQGEDPLHWLCSQSIVCLHITTTIIIVIVIIIIIIEIIIIINVIKIIIIIIIRIINNKNYKNNNNIISKKSYFW